MKRAERDKRVEEAVAILGPVESEEPTEDQWAAFSRWMEDLELGPATAQGILRGSRVAA